MKKVHIKSYITTLGIGLLCSCSHLSKKLSNSQSIEKDSIDHALIGPEEEDAGRPSPTLGGKRYASGRQNQNNQAIIALDSKTYRITLRDDEVWDALLSVLMRNYNLVVVDRISGVITTEWDSYYLSNLVYRNRISIRMRKVNRQQVELAVVNNVEKLQDGSAAGTVGAVWLPTDDGDKEAIRIVKNLAIMVNVTPPIVSPGMVAKGSIENSNVIPKGDVR